MGLIDDRRGSVVPILALLSIPVIAGLGLATEAGGWFLVNRSMQNAADSAALAASTNGCAATNASCVTAKGAYYDTEARSVAARLGFADGVADTTVTATNAAPCPSGDSNCYSVTVTRAVPLSITKLVGFGGDTTTSTGKPAQLLRAVAIARPRGTQAGFCMIGLSTSGTAIRINGGAKLDLAGCNLRSNSLLQCNGAHSDTGVEYGYAAGCEAGCGATRVDHAATIADPYAALNANPPIPANTCSSYPQGAAGPVLNPSANWTAPVKSCGDTRLTSDVVVTSPNAILAIYNGALNLNGHKLTTQAGASLTLIFSGTSKSNGNTTYHHYVTGSGTLDIAAPKTGTLSGVAIFQDARLTGTKNAVDFSYAGSTPTFNIQGLIYLPNAAFDMRGAINLHTGGLRCISVVADSILISGTGAVFNNSTSQCDQAGLVLPGVPGTETRMALVR